MLKEQTRNQCGQAHEEMISDNFISSIDIVQLQLRRHSLLTCRLTCSRPINLKSITDYTNILWLKKH